MHSHPRGRSRDPRLQVLQDESPSDHTSNLTAHSAPPSHSSQHLQQEKREASWEPRCAVVEPDKDIRLPVALNSVKVGAASNNHETPTKAEDNDLGDFLDGMSEAEVGAVMVERIRRLAEQESMLAARKLCLVLDLDHTLLNSAKFLDVSPELHTKLCSMHADEESMRSTGKGRISQQELFCFPHIGMWTKLRPGVRNFLRRAAVLFELHIYTMGNHSYAKEMARILDHSGALFSGRIIAKGDDAQVASMSGFERDEFGPPHHKDMDGVLGMESTALIVDDSAGVWPHHSTNLIVVERYMYFPASRRQFGLGGPSLLETRHDEREGDGMLSIVISLLEQIHGDFFYLAATDVRPILEAEKFGVLGGCHVLFSRIFPLEETRPDRHPLWVLAEQFGATCTMCATQEVTHVVATASGTEKVMWAQRSNKFVVRPTWLVQPSSLPFKVHPS